MNTVPRVLVGGPLNGQLLMVDQGAPGISVTRHRIVDKANGQGYDEASVVHKYRAGRHGDERMVYEGARDD